VSQSQAPYDVAVLGGHFAPAVLAAILAHKGARVLLIDAPGDRDEPSGEATVPYTSEVFALVAERFELPEIAAFAHFPDLPREVREVSGIKKSLGFIYHTQGAPQDPRRVVQFNVPGEHNELHIYRPAADEYLRQVAVKYGAERPGGDAVAAGVAAADEGFVITLSDGREYQARYLVDASGPDSPALEALGVPVRSDLRRLTSRTLVTRMAGVRPFEECAPLSWYRGATAWSAGTVHHLFDGGWIQIVGFGNHPGSNNALSGITVALDPAKYADLPAEPEAAFRALIAKYPSIAVQFVDAVAAEPWRTGEPWQRSATATCGERWFAMDRSAARTEELLSRDVTMSLEIVHALAAALLRILRSSAPSQREFERVARFQESLIEYHDQWLAGVRTATADFQLWNALSRVWLLWQILADLSLKRARLDCAPGRWTPVEGFEHGALWFRYPAGLERLLNRTFAQLELVREGSATPQAAARRIFRLLRKAPFAPPLYRFHDPEARYYHFTQARRLLMLLWVKTIAPRDFRRLLTRDNVTGERLAPVLELPPESEPTGARTAGASGAMAPAGTADTARSNDRDGELT
jgi:FADH2 O2-dependent halogenase